MLEVAVDAFLLCARYDAGGKFAGKQTVFGIIFPVAAAERRTVNVDRGSVPARIRHSVALFVADKRFFANELAHSFGKVEVPRCAHDAFALICASIVNHGVGNEAGEARRTIGIVGDGFVCNAVYAAYCTRAECSVAYERLHFVERNFVEKSFPAGVVVIYAAHIVALFIVKHIRERKPAVHGGRGRRTAVCASERTLIT